MRAVRIKTNAHPNMTKESPPKAQKNTRPQGKTPTEVRAEITQLYQNANNGIELAEALKAHHYTLKKSTRNVIFIIDPQGGEHNLFRRIQAPKNDIQAKLADLDPASLPLKKTRERENSIKCFVTPTEKKAITAQAKQARLSTSGYLRTLIFENENPHKASKRPKIENAELFNIRHQLRNIGGQLSQLASTQQQNKGFDNKAFNQLCTEHQKTLNAILTALNKA
jgi:hypothetical protein